MTVRHFKSNDAEFFQYKDRQIFVGDVLDSSNSDTMSVGFYRKKISTLRPYSGSPHETEYKAR